MGNESAWQDSADYRRRARQRQTPISNRSLDSADLDCNFGGDFALMNVLRKPSAELEKMLAE